MKRLIITADDYGFSKSVNQAIETCITAGSVNATCVMMNMPANMDVVSLRARFPRLSIGIHWTVTQGAPVLPASQIPSLVGANGAFYSKRQFTRRWLSNQINRDELKAELQAQFKCYSEMAGIPDFWNTHQDTHIFPGLFQAFATAGLELGIPAMRSNRRVVVSPKYTPTEYFVRHPAFWLKSKIVAQWSGWAETRGMRMPDGQVQLRGYDTSFAGLRGAFNRLQWESVRKAVELTVHPVTEIDEKVFSATKYSRVNQYTVLSDPQLKDLIQGLGIQMVGFDALK